MLFVIATLKIKPGSLNAVVEAVTPCIDATRKEDGCISYDLNRSVFDENELVFVERWKDRPALNAHFKQPHMKVWREIGGQYITGRKIEIIEDGQVEIL